MKKLPYEITKELAKTGVKPKSDLIVMHKKKNRIPFEIIMPNFMIKSRINKLITEKVFLINNKSYYAHLAIVLPQSDKLFNHHKLNNNLNISIDSDISDISVVAYLRTFYDQSTSTLETLEGQYVIDIYKIVKQLPTNLLSISVMECYLIKTYNKKYVEQYIKIADDEKFKYLIMKIYN